MAADTLHERFRAWLLDPAVITALAPDRFPASTQGAQQLIEAAMWAAYQQGYAACRTDVGRALDELGAAAQDQPS